MIPHRIYLHIGTGKTGTTAIQKFCLTNRDKLGEKGYLYPGFGLYGVGHHLLGHLWDTGWMPQERVDELVKSNLWDELRDIFLKTGKHMIISTETLSTAFVRKKHSIREVYDALADCDVVIIVYLRRQDLHFESVYNQRVKTGHSHKPISLNEPLPKLYDYYEFLESIRDIFGRDNMIVRPYEKGQFTGPHIFADFLNTCGLAWSDDFVLPEKDPNPRLHRDTLEFLRLANKIERPWEQKYLFNKFVLEQTIHAGDAEGEENDNLLSPREHLEIINRYSAGNKKVAEEYLGRRDAGLFLETLPDEDTKWQPCAELKLEQAVSLAVQIWESMQAQQNAVAKCGTIISRSTAVFTRVSQYLRTEIQSLWTRCFPGFKSDDP